MSADRKSRLAPRTLQIIGIVGLVASVTFWMVTGRESLLFVSTFASLALFGNYERAMEALRELTVPDSSSISAGSEAPAKAKAKERR